MPENQNSSKPEESLGRALSRVTISAKKAIENNLDEENVKKFLSELSNGINHTSVFADLFSHLKNNEEGEEDKNEEKKYRCIVKNWLAENILDFAKEDEKGRYKIEIDTEKAKSLPKSLLDTLKEKKYREKELKDTSLGGKRKRKKPWEPIYLVDYERKAEKESRTNSAQKAVEQKNSNLPPKGKSQKELEADSGYEKISNEFDPELDRAKRSVLEQNEGFDDPLTIKEKAERNLEAAHKYYLPYVGRADKMRKYFTIDESGILSFKGGKLLTSEVIQAALRETGVKAWNFPAGVKLAFDAFALAPDHPNFPETLIISQDVEPFPALREGVDIRRVVSAKDRSVSLQVPILGYVPIKAANLIFIPSEKPLKPNSISDEESKLTVYDSQQLMAEGSEVGNLVILPPDGKHYANISDHLLSGIQVANLVTSDHTKLDSFSLCKGYASMAGNFLISKLKKMKSLKIDPTFTIGNLGSAEYKALVKEGGFTEGESKEISELTHSGVPHDEAIERVLKKSFAMSYGRWLDDDKVDESLKSSIEYVFREKIDQIEKSEEGKGFHGSTEFRKWIEALKSEGYEEIDVGYKGSDEKRLLKLFEDGEGKSLEELNPEDFFEYEEANDGKYHRLTEDGIAYFRGSALHTAIDLAGSGDVGNEGLDKILESYIDRSKYDVSKSNEIRLKNGVLSVLDNETEEKLYRRLRDIPDEDYNRETELHHELYGINYEIGKAKDAQRLKELEDRKDEIENQIAFIKIDEGDVFRDDEEDRILEAAELQRKADKIEADFREQKATEAEAEAAKKEAERAWDYVRRDLSFSMEKIKDIIPPNELKLDRNIAELLMSVEKARSAKLIFRNMDESIGWIKYTMSQKDRIRAVDQDIIRMHTEKLLKNTLEAYAYKAVMNGGRPEDAANDRSLLSIAKLCAVLDKTATGHILSGANLFNYCGTGKDARLSHEAKRLAGMIMNLREMQTELSREVPTGEEREDELLQIVQGAEGFSPKFREAELFAKNGEGLAQRAKMDAYRKIQEHFEGGAFSYRLNEIKKLGDLKREFRESLIKVSKIDWDEKDRPESKESIKKAIEGLYNLALNENGSKRIESNELENMEREFSCIAPDILSEVRKERGLSRSADFPTELSNEEDFEKSIAYIKNSVLVTVDSPIDDIESAVNKDIENASQLTREVILSSFQKNRDEFLRAVDLGAKTDADIHAERLRDEAFEEYLRRNGHEKEADRVSDYIEKRSHKENLKSGISEAASKGKTIVSGEGKLTIGAHAFDGRIVSITSEERVNRLYRQLAEDALMNQKALWPLREAYRNVTGKELRSESENEFAEELKALSRDDARAIFDLIDKEGSRYTNSESLSKIAPYSASLAIMRVTLDEKDGDIVILSSEDTLDSEAIFTPKNGKLSVVRLQDYYPEFEAKDRYYRDQLDSIEKKIEEAAKSKDSGLSKTFEALKTELEERRSRLHRVSGSIREDAINGAKNVFTSGIFNERAITDSTMDKNGGQVFENIRKTTGSSARGFVMTQGSVKVFMAHSPWSSRSRKNEQKKTQNRIRRGEILKTLGFDIATAIAVGYQGNIRDAFADVFRTLLLFMPGAAIMITSLIKKAIENKKLETLNPDITPEQKKEILDKFDRFKDALRKDSSFTPKVDLDDKSGEFGAIKFEDESIPPIPINHIEDLTIATPGMQSYFDDLKIMHPEEFEGISKRLRILAEAAGVSLKETGLDELLEPYDPNKNAFVKDMLITNMSSKYILDSSTDYDKYIAAMNDSSPIKEIQDKIDWTKKAIYNYSRTLFERNHHETIIGKFQNDADDFFGLYTGACFENHMKMSLEKARDVIDSRVIDSDEKADKAVEALMELYRVNLRKAYREDTTAGSCQKDFDMEKIEAAVLSLNPALVKARLDQAIQNGGAEWIELYQRIKERMNLDEFARSYEKAKENFEDKSGDKIREAIDSSRIDDFLTTRIQMHERITEDWLTKTNDKGMSISDIGIKIHEEQKEELERNPDAKAEYAEKIKTIDNELEKKESENAKANEKKLNKDEKPELEKSTQTKKEEIKAKKKKESRGVSLA